MTKRGRFEMRLCELVFWRIKSIVHSSRALRAYLGLVVMTSNNTTQHVTFTISMRCPEPKANWY